MPRRNENWLLVEWGAGGRDVVYLKSVLNPVNRELKIGEVLTVNRRGEAQAATLIARAKERDQLDPRVQEGVQAAGPSPKPQDEPEDYSPSASSWAPSDEGVMSADSDRESVSTKKIKLEHYKRQYVNRRSNKKVIIPTYRANAVIPKSMQPKQDSSKKNDNRKRTHNERNGSIKKSLPDSTKRNNSLNTNVDRPITIDAREIQEIGNSFNLLFKMLEDLKRPIMMSNFCEDTAQQNDDLQIPKNEAVIHAVEDCEENDPYDPEEEFNRSDDNVLITNKYDSQYNATLAIKERFSKVNWKSYTIATRTLLLAVFPRRILATHSLTGKRSPAFQNKPAKMCLDPKIISDVIMEITDRFDVKENLVRSIITTKCADECKMLKLKTKKKKFIASNQENQPPKNEFHDNEQVPVN
ncbi:Uncharacterized protein OBRU01_10577 [Operophtera brumata]|uniref:BEN domain-containing protein n=1 Tax=Operophtera brumata TaxID=104452 RepID=A0A0L7LEG8_OPEBR|nr:Uncharacterized protein OBRU01_10577 [Operophtera brumata]